MEKQENIFSQILVYVIVAYMWIGGLFFVPYFNYQYAKDHGFVNWIFLGQIVPTLKAAVWPYFVYDHFNKEEWTDEQLESIVYMRQSMAAVVKVARLGEFLAEDDYSLKTFNKIKGFIRDAKTPADNVNPEVLKRLNPELAEQWETKYIEGLSLFERSLTLLEEGKAKEGIELAHESDRLLRAYFEWMEQADIKWPKIKKKRVKEIERQLEKKNVLPQVRADDPPNDAPHIEYYENGKKQSESHHKNGERNGLQTTWHENGQKEAEGHYKNGERNGLQTTWYENGQKETEGHFKGGKVDGLWMRWHENGQKKLEVNWNNGERDGLETTWYENGQKKLEANYNNGKPEGLWTLWYANGQKLSEAQYKDGKKVSSKEF